jgi:hypothetical protein
MRRFADRPFQLVVGDSGSSDGSLELLQNFAGRGWLELEIAELQRSHAEWLDHWLASCQTRVAVFVDSDVEILRRGWLSVLVGVLERQNAALAAAEFLRECRDFVEPVGHKRVRLAARPAPWLLAVDVAQVRPLGVSFAFQSEEQPDLPEGLVAYDVGGMLFRAIKSSGLRCARAPVTYRRVYRHYGGLSWIPPDAGERGAQKARDLRVVERRLAYLRALEKDRAVLPARAGLWVTTPRLRTSFRGARRAARNALGLTRKPRVTLTRRLGGSR